ncbi:uncharacterized protein LOC113291474 [Papaver somniferum]|uniref:uncharacterized protein LOC113291474 n=1 Tax=Papaver somniferum TaxID=3469 RepID=UPI000E6FD52C|nr:uncharacterized protein LOC113291474 [Papaver somniferum]
MKDDAAAFVQRCNECQIQGNLIHVPSTPLHSVSSPWPFYSWELDFIGKINPPSSKQHEYIITTTEYFNKWVEAIPLRGTTGATIAAFIKEHIICRFGAPKHIITDNGTPFANKQLPMALLAHRTAPRSSTGVFPYSLVCGADAILPEEIKIPSSRIEAASGVHWNEAEASSSRIAELDTLYSRRDKAEERTQTYRSMISRAYDKAVNPRVFKVGDLVLKTAKHIQQEMSTSKFSSKREGPYVITKVYNTGYYKIIKEDGGKLEAVINGKWIKEFYA